MISVAPLVFLAQGPTFFAFFSEQQHDPPGASATSPLQGIPVQGTPVQGTPSESTPVQGTPAQSTPLAAPSAPPQTTPQQGSFWTTPAGYCPDMAFIGHRQSSGSQPASASEEAEFLPTVQVQQQAPPPVLQGAMPMPTPMATSPAQLAPTPEPVQAVPPVQPTPEQAAPDKPTRPTAPQVIFPTHQLFLGPQAIAAGEPRWSTGTQSSSNKRDAPAPTCSPVPVVAKQSEENRITVQLPTKKRLVVVQHKKKRVVPPSTVAANASTSQATTQREGQPTSNVTVKGEASADTDGSPDDVPEQLEGVLSHSLFQWQAAENLIVNAIMLRTTSRSALPQRHKAVRFFSDLARATGEEPEAVLDCARRVVEDESSANSAEPHRLVVSKMRLSCLPYQFAVGPLVKI